MLQLCLSNVGTFGVASGFHAQRTGPAQSVSAESNRGVGSVGAVGS